MLRAKNIRTTGLLLVLLVTALLPVCVAWGSYYCQQPCTLRPAATVPYHSVARANPGPDLPGFPSLLLLN